MLPARQFVLIHEINGQKIKLLSRNVAYYYYMYVLNVQAGI